MSANPLEQFTEKMVEAFSKRPHIVEISLENTFPPALTGYDSLPNIIGEQALNGQAEKPATETVNTAETSDNVIHANFGVDRAIESKSEDQPDDEGEEVAAALQNVWQVYEDMDNAA